MSNRGTRTSGKVAEFVRTLERQTSAPPPKPRRTPIKNEIQGGVDIYPTKALAALSKSVGNLSCSGHIEPPPDPQVAPSEYQVSTIIRRTKKPLPQPKPSDYALLQKFFRRSTPLGEADARKLAVRRTEDGTTPLHQAARAGLAQECGALLRLGADLEAVDQWGYTAAHKAAAANSVEVLEVLNRFDANFEPGGIHCYLPLHRAAANGCLEAVKWLLQRCGKDALERKAYGGWTALHLAVWWDQVDVVLALLNRGANHEALTDDGSSPIKIAMDQGHEDIQRILLFFRKM